jgi:hypothetical protein
MSTDRVVVSDTVRITVKFKDIDADGNEVALSPLSNPQVIIKDSSNVTVNSGTSTQVSSSVFYYDYTPTIAGAYTVKFTGLLANSNTVVVEQKLYVSSTVEEYQPTIILKSDESITFAPDVTPLYLDPESLLAYFPDASLLEIGEIIYNYSTEVKAIYNLLDAEDGSNLSFTVLDAALRKEMLAAKVGPRGFQPKNLPGLSMYDSKLSDKIVYPSGRELYDPNGTTNINDDPMPKRGLRSYD